MAVPAIELYTKQWDTDPLTNYLTLEKPAGVQIDELLLLICINDDSVPTGFKDKTVGWNFIGDFGDTVSDSHIGLFWKIADGTEGATQDVFAESICNWVAWYVRISGVNVSTPINAVGVPTILDKKVTIDVSGVITDVNDCLALCFGCFDGGDGYPFTISGTGWNKEDECQSAPSPVDASGVWGYKQMSGSQGATGTVTIGASNSDGFAGVQIAIAPAPPSIMLLRPSAPGDECNTLELGFPCPYHYKNVNELNDAIYIRWGGVSYARDFYRFPNVKNIAISKITVYFRCQYIYASGTGWAKPVIKTHSTVFEGEEVNPPVTWTDYSKEWVNNPFTSLPWTVKEICNLQASVALHGVGVYATGCSEIYLELEYTPLEITKYLTGNDCPSYPHAIDVDSGKLPCPPPY